MPLVKYADIWIVKRLQDGTLRAELVFDTAINVKSVISSAEGTSIPEVLRSLADKIEEKSE